MGHNQIKQILRLKEVIASVYNTDPSAVELTKASKGSVIVYFTLPSSCIKELSDEHIVLLADHEFLELTIHDPDNDKVIISCNILKGLLLLTTHLRLLQIFQPCIASRLVNRNT